MRRSDRRHARSHPPRRAQDASRCRSCRAASGGDPFAADRKRPGGRASSRASSRSVPTRMPIRGDHSTPRRSNAVIFQRERSGVRSARLRACVMPSATVRLPGPRHNPPRRARRPAAAAGSPRRRHISVNALDRIERANQHRRRRSFRFGHRVHQVVDAVVQIHIRAAGRTVERLVSARRPGRGMTGGIVFADVRLGLDDDAGGAACRAPSCTSTLPISSSATVSVGRA